MNIKFHLFSQQARDFNRQYLAITLLSNTLTNANYSNSHEIMNPKNCQNKNLRMKRRKDNLKPGEHNNN